MLVLSSVEKMATWLECLMVVTTVGPMVAEMVELLADKSAVLKAGTLDSVRVDD